ncbi:hypothetical protein [Streptomyces varsoviensis]|uniref:hypothetical protein n=1 Tax=Streptomyces varsoviensis TaxID=67373 RepID=UPI00066211B3|nr:hypothetical protein [Streptomyces varsoviensis]
MLRYVIAPTGRYVKASHDVVRHCRLNSDAKILLLYVQGLPESEAARPLGEHARRLGITGRAFQKAKRQLVEAGYFHDWRWQGERGRWMTEQVFANVVLSAEDAVRVRDGAPPSARPPTVGGPTGRRAGGHLRKKKNEEKNSSRPPTASVAEARSEAVAEAPTVALVDGPATPLVDGPAVSLAEAPPAALAEGSTVTLATAPTVTPAAGQPAPDGDRTSPELRLRQKMFEPHLAEAERVLLSLRHTDRRLRLGAAEARELAASAVEWFLRGAGPRELREALTTGLPPEGVYYAPGFLRRRLADKLPEAAPSLPQQQHRSRTPQAPPRPAQFVTCQGPGNEHVFRPVADETHCAPCRQSRAEAAHAATFADQM